jgi:phosphoglycolate phosphatase-like HAD superfamily hydrolase
MVGRLAPRRDERGQEADTLLAACLQRYVELLPEELAAGKIDVLPGVRELLEALAADERVLTGLLTGNIEPGARLKLGAVGLWPYFAVGAFGSDSAHRADLPSIAVARAEALDGRRYAGKQVVVVGDTPADIACGVGMGVRSVAVATGRYSRDELAAHGPDAVLDDFADWRTAFRVIVN